MKPYIICHMVSSVDGKIDGAALSSIIADGDYEATGAKLKGNPCRKNNGPNGQISL
jgi:hypothetical protein